MHPPGFETGTDSQLHQASFEKYGIDRHQRSDNGNWEIIGPLYNAAEFIKRDIKPKSNDSFHRRRSAVTDIIEATEKLLSLEIFSDSKSQTSSQSTKTSVIYTYLDTPFCLDIPYHKTEGPKLLRYLNTQRKTQLKLERIQTKFLAYMDQNKSVNT